MAKTKTLAGIMTVTLVDRLLQIFFPGLILGTFLVQTAPLLLDSAGQYYLRKRLDADVGAFYAAVRAAHDVTLRERQQIGVEVSPEGWVIYRDDGLAWQRDEQDSVLSSGKWNETTKMGSTILDNKFFFDAQGRCYINQGTVCIDYPELNEPDELAEPKQPNILAFTSNANRIYTLFFGKNGAPGLEYDDF